MKERHVYEVHSLYQETDGMGRATMDEEDLIRFVTRKKKRAALICQRFKQTHETYGYVVKRRGKSDKRFYGRLVK